MKSELSVHPSGVKPKASPSPQSRIFDTTRIVTTCWGRGNLAKRGFGRTTTQTHFQSHQHLMSYGLLFARARKLLGARLRKERMSIQKKYSNNKAHAALEVNASGKAEQVDKKPFLYILCPHTMQNQLLTDYLAKGTGHHAACGTQFWAFRSKNNGNKSRYLVLIDCHKFDATTIWSSIGANILDDNRNTAIALFNVDSGLSAQVEPTAIERGIRGVFYEDLSLDMLLKGVESVLAGELWYSRKAVSRYLKKTSSRSLVQPNENTPLTSREKEILRFLITGKSNTEIADELNISIHTVKTHIYNLYKKIDVPNRLQAVLWAARHLPFI